MALLDQVFLGSLPQSAGFPVFDPAAVEVADAEEARRVAARRLARGAGRPATFEERWPSAPMAAPDFGLLADIGMAGMTPAGGLLDSQSIPLPRPRPEQAPVGAPTDLSAVARAPVMPAPVAPAVPESGWDKFWGKVPEASTLLALAGGFAGAPSIGIGMQRAFSGAAPMVAINERQTQQRNQQNLTVKYLMARGMSEADAKAAVSNPTLLAALLKKPDIPAGYRAAPGGNLEFIPGGPADPAVKRALGDRQNAPSGYVWVDPENPEKGMKAVPGGPAGKLPSEVAGRLALMHEAAQGIPEATKILMQGRGETGTGVSGAVASYTNIGDTGRAQRTIRTAIEGVLRAMTGAAAPESEVTRYENMFMPSPFDSPATAKQKIGQLQGFIDRATKLITMGHGGVEALNAAVGGAPMPTMTGPLGVGQSRNVNGVTITRVN